MQASWVQCWLPAPLFPALCFICSSGNASGVKRHFTTWADLKDAATEEGTLGAANSSAIPPLIPVASLCHKCLPHSALHTEEVPKKSNWRTFCWISKVKGLNEKLCENHSCSKGEWQMVWLVKRGRRNMGGEGKIPLYSAQWAQLYHVTAPPGWGSIAGQIKSALALCREMQVWWIPELPKVSGTGLCSRGRRRVGLCNQLLDQLKFLLGANRIFSWLSETGVSLICIHTAPHTAQLQIQWGH